MTKIVLDYPRLGTIELVVTAFENVRGLSRYEVDAERGVVTGWFDGGVTSFGAKISVSILEETNEPRTTVAVTASRRVSFNRNSNPWKYKSAFVQELRKLEGKPVDDLRNPPSGESRPEYEGSKDGRSVDERNEQAANSTAQAMQRGTRIILYLLLVGLGVMVAVTIVALLV